MAYIGAEPLPGQNREVDDISSSFNGSTTAFTLQVSGVNVSPETANNILVNIGGVIQNPGTDYTIAASTITFTTAPASGLSFFAIILGAGINTATVADGVITSAKLASDISLTGDVSIADKIVHTGDTNTAIRFPAADTFTAETGGSERLRITSTGKVGIGTTNPAEQLVVMGSGDPTIRIQETASGSGKRLDLGVTDSGAVGFIGANQSASKLAFQTVGSERMRIDDNGNVGIALTPTNGQGILQINGGLRIAGSASASDTSAPYIFRTSGADNMVLATSGTERMRIDSSGNVLVGTTSTSLSSSSFGIGLFANNSASIFMDVSGATTVVRMGGNQGLVKVQGDGDLFNTNNTYGQVSDETLKQDIVDAASQWNDIKNLRVRKFRFKDNPTGVLQIGVIAQEIEKVSAGLVQEDDEGIKSVKYSVLYMKAIKALQEAITKIETLETKVAALEAA